MIHQIVNNKRKKVSLTTFINPFSYLKLRQSDIHLNNFNIKIDGFFLVSILNFFGFKFNRESFDMTSLAPIIFEKIIREKKTVFFVGTEPNLIKLSVDNIKSSYPNLNISGFHHGFFTNEEKDMIFNNIISSRVDYVICGMGTPLQEKFLIDLKENGWSGIGFTCGGFLHQTSNNIIYYPNWIDRFSLRAFYRMYDEPKLIKRYFLIYPLAILLFLYDLFKFRFSRFVNFTKYKK